MSHCVVILPSVPSNKKGDCLTNSKSALDMISMCDLDEKTSSVAADWVCGVSQRK